MTGAVLSIGSNVGDRLAHLRGCVHGLGDAVRAVSPVYATAAWGGVAQRDFLNAVVLACGDGFGPRQWLRAAQQQESHAARRRGVRWGPRTLDVDVITVDGARCASRGLTLPHPWAHRRAFVLIPWLAVDPDAELPGHGRVVDLVETLPGNELAGVRRRDDLALLDR